MSPAPREPDEPSPTQKAEKAGDKKEAELTAEEQLALYEKELKENDWGHQPC